MRLVKYLEASYLAKGPFKIDVPGTFPIFELLRPPPPPSQASDTFGTLILNGTQGFVCFVRGKAGNTLVLPIEGLAPRQADS